MSYQTELKENDNRPQMSSGAAVTVETPEAAPEQQKRTVKGMLMMAVGCTAPLLLLAATPFLGASFGSLAAAGSGLLSMVALLACPVGMFVMMRTMKDKN